MAIPEPRPGEKKIDFLNRCMADPSAQSQFPNSDERTEVCLLQFKAMERAGREDASRFYGSAVRRYDVGLPLPRTTRTDEGYIRAPATRIARTGVQEYRREDGTVQRELRLPEEVFAQDSLDSADGKPVVHHHPGRVDKTNVRHYMGGVATKADQDGQFLIADLTVHDDQLIRAAERGDSEISLGYDTILIPIPGGVFRKDGHMFDGERADFLQTNIRINHVALLPHGRANEGLSDRPVRLRLDSSGHQIDQQQSEETNTVKIKVDGVEHDVPDAVAQHIEKQATDLAAAKTDAADAKKKADEASARADTIESRVKALEEQKADTEEQKQEAEKKQREDLAKMALASEAEKLKLKRKKDDGSEEVIPMIDLLAMGVPALQRQILSVRAPELKLDGQTDDYIAAALDYVRAQNNTSGKMAQAISQTEPKSDSSEASGGENGESPLAAAQSEYHKRADAAWRPKAQ